MEHNDVIIPGVSDHDAVLMRLNMKPLRNKQTPRKIPLYKKADCEGLKKHITEFGRSLQSNFNFSTLVNQLWCSNLIRVFFHDDTLH